MMPFGRINVVAAVIALLDLVYVNRRSNPGHVIERVQTAGEIGVLGESA